MKKIIHSTHTVWEIRPWTKEKCGVVLIKHTGDKLSLKSLFCKENIRFHYNKPNKKQWFLFIRLPFLYIEKNNFNFYIGTPNKYIWFIT